MINPNDITTVRVGELPIAAINPNAKFPFETSDQFLKQNTIQALLDYFALQSSAIQFQIIDLWVTEAYIESNLDITGLGINTLTGYALCNGQNGTPNLDGRTTIGYGSTYLNIGGFGGNKDSVVVSHSHSAGAYNTGGGNALFTSKGLASGADTVYSRTNTEGESGTNKNMQPYMVALKVMKL